MRKKRKAHHVMSMSLWYGIFLRVRNMFLDEKTHQLHISQVSCFAQQLLGRCSMDSSNIPGDSPCLVDTQQDVTGGIVDPAGKGLIHAWSWVNSAPTIPRDFCWCHIGRTRPILLGGKVSSWCLNIGDMGVFGSKYHHVWVFAVTGSQKLIAEPFKFLSVLISRWNSKIAAWKKKKQKNNNTNTNTNDDNAKRRWQDDVWFLFPWDHLDRADLEWSLRYQHLSTTALQL